MPKNLADRGDIIRKPFLPFRKRDVREAAHVQAVVIIAEQDRIADRDKRCPLPAQRHIGRPEIAHRVNARHSCNAGARADLCRKPHCGLMENGLAMRSHQIDLQVIPRDETTHCLAQEKAIIRMQTRIVQCRHRLGMGQSVTQFGWIILTFGLDNVIVPASVIIESDAAQVQPVERSARHQADHINRKIRGFHRLRCHRGPLQVS